MATPRRKLGAAAAVVGALGLAAAPFALTTGAKAPDETVTYEVTITNLTRGQALTPPVVSLDRTKNVHFRVGDPASLGVREIAENGNLMPLLDTLGADNRAAAVASGATPLVPRKAPGAAMFPDRVTFQLSADASARYLSWTSMLICTNDGFTGVNALPLPDKGSVTVRTQAYDSGTERNTEDFADIVPPCQGLIGVSSGEPGTDKSNLDLLTDGVIEHHQGIEGGNDLVPRVHGWQNPVAKVTVSVVG